MTALRLVAARPAPEDLPKGCDNVLPDVMFPDERLNNRHPDVLAAKDVCLLQCPRVVREECLTGALKRREEFGVWGGLSTKERNALIRRSNRLRRGQTETLMDVAL